MLNLCANQNRTSMKTTLLVVGRTVEQHFITAINDYVQRTKRYLSFEMEVIPELKNTKSLSMEVQKEKEGELILKALQPGDVVIGMSFSGKAEGVVEALNLIRKEKRGITVIAITAFPNSPITKLSNVNLFYSCNIYDDLQYLHVARMCEISIIGILQTGVVNYISNIEERNMNSLKYAITSRRTK